jgi:hypothetical protein
MHRKQICQHAFDAVEDLPGEWTERGKGRGKGRRARTPDSQGVPWEVFLGMNKTSKDAPFRTQSGLPAIRRWLQNYQVGGTAAMACERLLDRCQAHGVAAILVGVPVTRAHRELYGPEIDAAFLAYVNDLCSRRGCRFEDYRAEVPDHLFLDNHHVLREGGLYFSKRLTDEVLLPVWKEVDRPATASLTAVQ